MKKTMDTDPRGKDVFSINDTSVDWEVIRSKYGVVEIEPNAAVTVGSHGRWVFRYTVGSEGILQGGGIKIKSPQVSAAWMMRRFVWDFGLVTAKTNGKVKVRASVSNNLHGQVPEIIITVHNGSLLPGQMIEVVIGDMFFNGSPQRAIVQEIAYPEVRFCVFIDWDGTDKYVLLPDSPIITVIPDQPDSIKIVKPSIILPREKFTAKVRIEDQFTNVAQSSETLIIQTKNSETAMNVNNGLGHITLINDNQPEQVSQIKVKMTSKNIGNVSNSSWNELIEGKYRVFFGDIHGHCSDRPPDYPPAHGLGTPEQYFSYARDISFLDFTALTELPEVPWEEIKQLVRQYYNPGSFVTFLAYEWFGHKNGHRNVYYRGEEGRRIGELETNGDPRLLWSKLKEQGLPALTVPHHINAQVDHSREVSEEAMVLGGGYYDYNRTQKIGTVGWQPCNWDYHDTRFERLVEVAQVRSSFERDQLGEGVVLGGFGASVQDALARGYRLGLIASTDTHLGRPGAKDRAGVTGKRRGALAVVYAEELTREKIFDALYARRCYAATDRILLYFSVDNHLMGDEVQVEEHQKHEIFLRVAGTAKIKKITVIRNNCDVYSTEPDSNQFEFNWIDNQTSKFDIRSIYYYVRVTQVDGEIAWSSPVWFSKKE